MSSVSFIHCCVQKTASQWFFALYSDPRFQSLTGLNVLSFTDYVELCQGLPNWQRDPEFYRAAYEYLPFSAPFPGRTIGCPFYIGYRTYLEMTKKSELRALFVTRDPRDLMLSGYFSLRDSHPDMEVNSQMRSKLRTLNFADGLKHYLEYIIDLGLFEAQVDWHRAANKDTEGHIKLIRYEDLADRYTEFFLELLRVFAPDCKREHSSSLMHRFSFQSQKTSSLFPKGHLRRGRSGEWSETFTPEFEEFFVSKTGNLVYDLGYSPDRETNKLA